MTYYWDLKESDRPHTLRSLLVHSLVRRDRYTKEPNLICREHAAPEMEKKNRDREIRKEGERERVISKEVYAIDLYRMISVEDAPWY